MPTIDYQLLLMKYMAFVMHQERTSHVGAIDCTNDAPPEARAITTDEVIELMAIESLIRSKT